MSVVVDVSAVCEVCCCCSGVGSASASGLVGGTDASPFCKCGWSGVVDDDIDDMEIDREIVAEES